jgi:hypothetical protein
LGTVPPAFFQMDLRETSSLGYTMGRQLRLSTERKPKSTNA